MIPEHVKRHAAVPAAVVALGLLALLIIHIIGLKDNANIEFVHISGDESVLDGIVISGTVADSYHRLDFRIADDKAEKHTVLYEEPQYARPLDQSFGGRVVYNNRSYEVWPVSFSGWEYNIRFNQFGKNVAGGGARVSTKTTYVSSGEEGYRFTNPFEYGLAFSGDKVFFVPTTGLQHRGTSGIYEVTALNSDWASMEKKGADHTRLLFELDLSGNDYKQGLGLEVLGLEAVGDRLALIVAQDGELAVRVYDSETGALLGEVRLGEYVGGIERTAAVGEGYYEHYEAFGDERGQMLNLKFISNASTGENSRFLVVSLSFRDGVELVNKVSLSHPMSSGDYWSNELAYVNGRLYEAIYAVKADSDRHTGFHPLREREMFINVYEGEHVVYKGQLITDIMDDNIYAVYGMPPVSISYDGSEYRLFEQIQFRAAGK